MNDPNRVLKWLFVIFLVVVSLSVLYPPSQKLKGGIDLVGGTSLLFEIDTTGLEAMQQRDLSQKVMRVLKERVDPRSQMNLEWRPVGSSRLEIRMPRPPKEALARREAYNAVVEKLQAKNVRRRAVEEVLTRTGTERESALQTLVVGIEGRRTLLDETAKKFDEYTAAREAGDTAAQEVASKAYESAIAAVVATSLPVGRLSDVLALPAGARRDEEIDKLRKEYPSYDAGEPGNTEARLLSRAVSAYDAWSANKADLEDPSDLKRRLRGAGVLEFRILADRDLSSPDMTSAPGKPGLAQPITRYVEQLKRSGPRPNSGDRYQWFPLEDVNRFTGTDDKAELETWVGSPGRPIVEEYAGRWYVLMHKDAEFGLLQPRGAASQWALKLAYADRNPMTGENVVAFQLDGRGGRLFGELTGSNVQRDLCILLDGQAVSYANIEERITDRCQIRGRFTSERVQELVNTLEAGSLPARLKETPLSEQTIGPSLGETNRRNGLNASLWAAGSVVVFVLFYYGIAGGGIANMALFLNVLFVLAMMALMQATFTLPGIAGLILTVGMAIDANVLIFERIREERARGVVFRKALNAGYDKAFSAIFDSNLTTLITCVILGFVSSEEVKGFAITLGLGLVTSMFTALFCTRLAFNTLAAKGMLSDFSMRRLIGIPKIDWVALRRTFLPLSGAVVALGLILFLNVAYNHPERMFDIEFLGGTSVQVDLKPGIRMTDEQMLDAVTQDRGPTDASAVQWIRGAADALTSATVSPGETPAQFVVSAQRLSGEELVLLLHKSLESALERDGAAASGSTATFTLQAGKMTVEEMKARIATAAEAARGAAERLRGARVQSIGESEGKAGEASSFEVVTVETNRRLVQAGILGVLGDKLAVQRSIGFAAAADETMTRDRFFVIETDDQYLSDVLPTDVRFDVRRFRGGVAIDVGLDERESPLTSEAFEARLREVGLHPEFEQFRTRETTVFPLGAPQAIAEGGKGYKRFAVCAVDESLLYDDDKAQWAEAVASNVLHQVEAALGSEKSLSKVIQFAPQIAGQTRNRAVFAIVLSMAAIGVYIWFRFGNRDYGYAVVVAVVHDVVVTLGVLGVSQYVYNNFLARALLLEDFKIDLSVVAAILTVIGYSMNDTIVVFDRIRENKGRSGTLNINLVNDSINQTMSRTVLTSLTVFFTVVILYIFGGKGVHGFSFALVVGVISGTYSTVAIAVPLIYDPRLLNRVMIGIVLAVLLGFAVLITTNATPRLVMVLASVVLCAWWLVRSEREIRAQSGKSFARA